MTRCWVLPVVTTLVPMTPMPMFKWTMVPTMVVSKAKVLMIFKRARMVVVAKTSVVPVVPTVTMVFIKSTEPARTVAPMVWPVLTFMMVKNWGQIDAGWAFSS
ncbi:hypothetical protein Zmor_022244 [Zophobas morio]|uniref:Uncharacterized protein n=1 Tax=Zophobas morio TaxID=2755281 RepID=A0AA38I0T2_9CUCU|nr:hypothetical protein Zmor_022244 [Zophobas morio]